MKEEIGCHVKIISQQPKVFEILKPSNKFHGIFFAFLCQLEDESCQIKINREASMYKWFQIEEIYKLDSLGETKEIINWLRDDF